MRIVELKAENVKRLHAVRIVPDSDMVVIAGKNGQGKSSVLDAIEMALGGQSCLPPKPVHEGSDSAYIKLKLDNGLVVKRKISSDGKSTLHVESQDGAKYSSPQSMLNAMLGELSFDPLSFSRMKPKEQLEALRKIAGIDTASLDQERKFAYDQRTEINREIKRLESEIASFSGDLSVQSEEIDVGELMSKLKIAQEIENKKTNINQTMYEIHTEIKDLTSQIKNKEDRFNALQIQYEALLKEPCEDVALIQKEIVDSQRTNEQVRQKRKRLSVEENLLSHNRMQEKITQEIKQLDDKKESLIKSAKLPMKNISFDDEHVLLDGIPFEQASSAEQLRASVAMGIALNPKLRVLLVRDGSLLDSDSLKLLAQMAEEHDCQVWVERVDTTDGVGIVIEDGEVKS